MAIPHAKPGERIDVRPLGAAIAGAKTATLVKTADMELIRLVLPAGKEISTHRAPGEITVQCLEGKIHFTSPHGTEEMTAGELLYLAAAEPHSLRATEPSTALVTILLRRT